MKYLHLQILRLRVWHARRNLRQMGLREPADRITPEMIMRLGTNIPKASQKHLRWFEVIFFILGILVWLTFDIRDDDSPKKSPSFELSPPVAPSQHKVNLSTDEEVSL